jgi:hypothetical protein
VDVHRGLLLLIPVLLFLDRWLTLRTIADARTVKGGGLRARDLELNPLWRESVEVDSTERGRWLIAISTLTVLLTVVAIWYPLPMLDLLLGTAFAALGGVLGRHVSNILLLRDLRRHPEEVSRLGHTSYAFSLRESRDRTLGAIPLVVLLLLAGRSWLLAGAVLGVVGHAGIHSAWEHVYRRRLEGDD